MNEKPNQHPVCRYCGSDDVYSEGNLSWNKSTNDWELLGVYDGGSCNTCHEEQKYFNWVDTPAEKQP